MKIELYVKDNCSSCDFARTLLTSNEVEYVEKKIGQDISVEELLKLFPGVRVAPVIVMDGQVSTLGAVERILLTEGE